MKTKKILMLFAFMTANLMVGCNNAKKYTVSFNTNSDDVIFDVTVNDGQCVQRPRNPLKQHFEFADWYTDNDSFQYKYNFLEPVRNNLTLHAKYIQSEFKVTYYSFNGREPHIDYVKKGSKVIPPTDPTRGDSQFLGWFYNSGRGMLEEFDFNTTIVDKDISLYAKWSNYCTVAFETNGGDPIEPLSVPYDKPISTPIITSRNGYLFNSWHTEQDFSDPNFDITQNIKKDYLLFAKWDKACVVNFVSNVPDHKIEPVTLAKGDYVEEPEIAWIRHRLKGWYNNPEFSGDPFDFTGTPIVQDIWLYAKWNELLLVQFNCNGGTKIDSLEVESGDKIIKPDNPTYGNCTFGGWYLDNNTFREPFDFNAPVTQSVTLYARWTVAIVLEAEEVGAVVAENWQSVYAFYQTVYLYDPSHPLLWQDVVGSTIECVYENYDFICWNLNGTPILRDTIIDKDVEVTASYALTSKYLTIISRSYLANTIMLRNKGCDLWWKFEDDGQDWQKVEDYIMPTFAYKFGARLFLKGKNNNGIGQTIFSTGAFSVSGLPDSLITNKDQPVSGDLPKFAFGNLFNGCNAITSAYNLFLPNLNASEECYKGMFANSGLSVPPKLISAETLSTRCYDSMFANCLHLKKVPDVATKTFAGSYCYSSMFAGCTSLTEMPELPITTLSEGCYFNMFAGCTSLTSTRALSADTLPKSCYEGMFQNCTGLTTVGALTLIENLDDSSSGCYKNMFAGCSSLEVILDDSHIFFYCPHVENTDCIAGMFSDTKAHRGDYTPTPGVVYSFALPPSL